MEPSGSLEALQLQQKPLTEEQNCNLEEKEQGKEAKEEEEEEPAGQLSESNQSLPLGELPSSQVDQFSESQPLAPLATISRENDHCVGLHDTSASDKDAESKFKDGVSNSEVSTCAMTRGVESQPLNELQTSQQSVSVKQSVQSPSKSNNAQIPETDHHDSPNFKSLSVPIVKAQVSDGYNWRKYGQKQVKSPTGSRSYYKCTFSDCCAKKIECADHSGNIVEIVNKGNHSHDPPQKNNSTTKSKVALSSPPVVQDNRIENSEKAASSQESKEAPPVLDKKRQNSSGCNESNFMQKKEDRVSEPEPKRRLKKENLETDGTPPKPGKKPKFVVHAAGDVGISGDGYRWRKYGQKMVKGNPNPRNYYRCTSAGCPVRKLIETAADNTSAMIITYKGVHDHDMPVPKKRHGQPSAPLLAAAAPASMLRKPDAPPQNQVTSTQWSVGKGGELKSETLDVGGDKDKAIESARTLLSIGFEIKPC